MLGQKGALYLLDYEVLDGVPENVINGKQTYPSAPLCLLHLNQQGQLLPIAIQVSSRGRTYCSSPFVIVVIQKSVYTLFSLLFLSSF